MGFDLTLFNGDFNNNLIQKQAVNEVLKYNDLTMRFGLILNENQATELVETRFLALKDTGRIEFGGGVIDKIIYQFCDSPYISMHNYEQTLHELIEMFYYCKNDMLDLISDEELIKYMESAFNGVCQGSLELLLGRELYNLSQSLRNGYPIDCDDLSANNEEDEDGEY